MQSQKVNAKAKNKQKMLNEIWRDVGDDDVAYPITPIQPANYVSHYLDYYSIFILAKKIDRETETEPETLSACREIERAETKAEFKKNITSISFAFLSFVLPSHFFISTVCSVCSTYFAYFLLWILFIFLLVVGSEQFLK